MILPEVETNAVDHPDRAAPGVLVLVPYVDGMLREQTMHAVHASGLTYLTQPLDPAEATDYAAAFRSWWDLDLDIVIVEQDMVPTVEQFRVLAAHPADWASMYYHVGEGRHTTGLGFCKIRKALRERHPHAGVNISLDPRNSRDLIGWASLNENVERHLTRLGEQQTVIGDYVEHLHYPAASGG